MAVRRTITVAITQEQDDLIRACLRSGRFASTSEVVRAALRLLDREEATLTRTTQTSEMAGGTSS